MTRNTPYSTALVTGAAHRIGRSIALSLTEQGFAIAVHHRSSSDAASQLVEKIQKHGGNAAAIACDLNDFDQVSKLVTDASKALGAPIDVLVNNASVFEKDELNTLDQQSWDLHQNVNLRAPVFLSQAMAAQLPAGHRGAIINIIDQRVLKLNPQYFSYTASKAGLWTTTRTMAQSLAPAVRVNAISPGPTLANQFQASDDFDQESRHVMLGAGPALSEITEATKFLLETPSITGQMITLDGGQHLAWRTADILED